MDSLLADFESLKISAFSKFSQLTGNVNQVTIGPNSTINKSKEVYSDKDIIKSPFKKKSVEKNVKIEDSNEDDISYRHIIKELELQRLGKVEEAVVNRCKQFNDFIRKQKEQQQNEWLRHQQHIMEDMHKHEQIIVNTLSEHDSSKSQDNEKLVKHYQDMIQRKQQYEEQIEKAKEKQRLCKENVEKINKCQIEFRLVFQEIITLIKSCSSVDELKRTLSDNFKLLKTIPENMDEIVSKCKGLNISEEEIAKAYSLLVDLKNFKVQIQAAVDQVNQKQKESSAPPPEPSKKLEPEPKTSEKVSFSLKQCISVTNLKRYSEIKQFLSQYQFKELLENDSYKQFRFDCKKAINLPVNALSAVSSDHLKDKYVRLYNLLAGKNVVVGDKQVNATQHPQGIAFCTDLLAKKFVLQGDLMISSNPEAAFCYATLIVTLWNDFPDFGRLLLGHFYTQCPYLIPFYIPRTEEQSDEDYYVSLGYSYNDGQIEKQDKFIKRMTGIMRLYFALFIARPRRGQNKHPHGIRNAWLYLVSILKIEPQMDITATALHTFLETVGFQMEATYGNIFKKLVKILREEFLPVLKKIDTGGPVARLELLLQEHRKNGKFERPSGILSPNFW